MSIVDPVDGPTLGCPDSAAAIEAVESVVIAPEESSADAADSTREVLDEQVTGDASSDPGSAGRTARCIGASLIFTVELDSLPSNEESRPRARRRFGSSTLFDACL